MEFRNHAAKHAKDLLEGRPCAPWVVFSVQLVDLGGNGFFASKLMPESGEEIGRRLGLCFPGIEIKHCDASFLARMACSKIIQND
jgi:hypothetical protein